MAIQTINQSRNHAGLTEVRYVHPNGDNNRDGLTWATAKQYILQAYDSLPATGGTIYIADGSNVGGEVANQGIWIIGPNDSQYASPPTGWRQQKQVKFIGVPGTGSAIQFAMPSAIILGGTTTFNYDGTNKPAIWLAGTDIGIEFENLGMYYVGVGIRAGVNAAQTDRSCNTALARFTNVNIATYNSGVSKSTPGNCVDIGYLFWGWFDHCVFLAYAPAARDSDQRAAVLVKPDPAGAGSGLLFFRDIISASGGVKFYSANTAWSLNVDNWVHEGSFTTAEPAAINFAGLNATGQAYLKDVGRADIDPAISFATDINVAIAANALSVVVIGGGSVTGPHTRMPGAYQGAVTDLALQRSSGFANGTRNVGSRLVAQHDAANRKFGLTAARFTNLAPQDVTTWSSKVGSATVTTGQLAPDGTTNAAKLSSGSFNNRQIYRATRTFAVGDWVVAGVWIKPVVAGGVGGSPGAISINTNPPTYIVFDSYSSGAYFGGEPDGVAGKWDWKAFASKVITVNTSNPELILSLQCDNGHDMVYYAPVLLHIPAGTFTDDEVMELTYHLNPWPDGVPVGSVSTLLGQDLYAQSHIIQSGLGTYHEFKENGTTDAAAGAVNTVRLYAKDNGAGKTQLIARFNTGAVQVIATEP